MKEEDSNSTNSVISENDQPEKKRHVWNAVTWTDEEDGKFIEALFIDGF